MTGMTIGVFQTVTSSAQNVHTAHNHRATVVTRANGNRMVGLSSAAFVWGQSKT